MPKHATACECQRCRDRRSLTEALKQLGTGTLNQLSAVQHYRLWRHRRSKARIAVGCIANNPLCWN